MLNEGQPAPPFRLKNAQGNDVALSDYKGKKVILYFYPKDDTPGCTRESIGFSEQIEALADKNTVVIGISKDSVESHQKFATKYDLKVELLSDPDMDAIQAYGVWQEKKNYGKTYMGIVRTTYLINEDQTVGRVWKNVKVNGHVEAVCAVVA